MFPRISQSLRGRPSVVFVSFCHGKGRGLQNDRPCPCKGELFPEALPEHLQELFLHEFCSSRKPRWWLLRGVDVWAYRIGQPFCRVHALQCFKGQSICNRPVPSLSPCPTAARVQPLPSGQQEMCSGRLPIGLTSSPNSQGAVACLGPGEYVEGQRVGTTQGILGPSSSMGWLVPGQGACLLNPTLPWIGPPLAKKVRYSLQEASQLA